MREERKTQLAISFIPSPVILAILIPFLMLFPAPLPSADRETLDRLRQEIDVLRQELVATRVHDCENVEDDGPPWSAHEAEYEMLDAGGQP
jgi:hypothetical protein